MVHHEFRKGQKILLILNNGTIIIDKYKFSNSKSIRTENCLLQYDRIRSSTIYKNGVLPAGAEVIRFC